MRSSLRYFLLDVFSVTVIFWHKLIVCCVSLFAVECHLIFPLALCCFCSVEVCIFVIGSSRVPPGLRHCVQSVSGLSNCSLSLSTCPQWCHLLWDVERCVLISACHFSFCREGMFMVLGSSILGWNTRTMLLKGRTQPIRYVIAL